MRARRAFVETISLADVGSSCPRFEFSHEETHADDDTLIAPCSLLEDDNFVRSP